MTADWYVEYLNKNNLEKKTISQISNYLNKYYEKNRLKKHNLNQVKLFKFSSFKDHRGIFNKIYSEELLPFLKKRQQHQRNQSLLFKKRALLEGCIFK